MPGTIDPPLEHAAISTAMSAVTTAHNGLTLMRHTQTSKEADFEKDRLPFEHKRRFPAEEFYSSGGSHSSTGLPSGSTIRANLPVSGVSYGLCHQ
jgi:hypothetical protein